LNIVIEISPFVWEVQATSPKPGIHITEHDAIPRKPGYEAGWIALE
jgi:hypothetical protein